jgi:hypothetical protein
VGTVAFGSVARVFALTKIGGFIGFGLKNDRCKRSSFVRAVAKGLAVGQTASAIGVLFSSFQFNLLGKTRCDFWFVHIVPVLIVGL